MQCPLEINQTKIKYEVYLKHDDANHSIAIPLGEEEEEKEDYSQDEGEDLHILEEEDEQVTDIDEVNSDDEMETSTIMHENNSQYMNCKVKMVNKVTKEKFIKKMLAYFKSKFALHHNTMKWQDFFYRRSLMNLKKESASLVRNYTFWFIIQGFV